MKRFISVFLVLAMVLSASSFAFAANLGKVTYSANTSLKSKFNSFESLTLKEGVTLTTSMSGSEPQGIEMHGPLVLEEGAKITGKGIILMFRGSSFSGMDFWYQLKSGELKQFPDMDTAYEKYTNADDFVFEFSMNSDGKWVFKTILEGDPFEEPKPHGPGFDEPVVHVNKSLDNFKNINTFVSGAFKDVVKNSWYESGVQRAYELGLMKGSSVNSFNPDGDISIAETITLAARIHKKYNTGVDNFVQGSPWYQVYVDYAIENGIISNGEYSNLNAKATREQFANILAKSLPAEELPAINIVEDGAIPDVADSPFKDVVYTLYKAGILTGNDTKGTFAPKTNIGRSAVAAIVTRMVDQSLRKNITLIDTSFRDIKD